MLWRFGTRRLLREHRLTTRRCLDRLSDADPRHLPDFEVWGVVEEWSGHVADSLQRLEWLDRAQRQHPTVRRYAVWHDELHSDLMRVLEALRDWHLALAERFVERRWLDRQAHYFLLEREEIAAIVNGRRGSDTLRGLAAERVRTNGARLTPSQTLV